MIARVAKSGESAEAGETGTLVSHSVGKGLSTDHDRLGVGSTRVQLALPSRPTRLA